MKELDYNIKINTIKALGYIQDASAEIYSLNNLTVPIWTGTVNSIGKVVDIYGNSPYLSYGDYRVVIEKCDYDTEISDFRVPDTSLVNLTVGCSSAITAHEAAYDHSLIGQGIMLPAGIGPLPYAGITPPAGWLLCNGTAISRTTYARLFAVIGTIYGAGDGVNTFNLPDMKGRVPVGIGGSGATNLGSQGGEQTHTLTIAEMPAHTHNANCLGPTTASGAGYDNNSTTPTSSTGGDQPHNNMQPYLGVNYIIST